MLFDKKKRTITVEGKTIELQPKPKGLGGLFSRKPAAQPKQSPQPAPQSPPVQPQQQPMGAPKPQPPAKPEPHRFSLFGSKPAQPKPVVQVPAPKPAVPPQPVPVQKPAQQTKGFSLFGSGPQPKPAAPTIPPSPAQQTAPKSVQPPKPHGIGIFGGPKRTVMVDGKAIELQPKPGKGLGGLFAPKPKVAQQPKPVVAPVQIPKPQPVKPQQPAGKGFSLFGARPQQPKPVAAQQPAMPQPKPPQQTAVPKPKPEFHLFQKPAQGARPAPQTQQQRPAFTPAPAVQPRPGIPAPGAKPTAYGKPSAWRLYVEGIGNKRKGLEQVLREQKIANSLYDFVQRMIIISAMLAAVIGIVIILLFVNSGQNPVLGVVLGGVIAFAVFQMALTNFLSYPEHRTKVSTKNIERDILFASRDMIISLRSGMPLFNAITSVSTGYGEASREFAKIVEKVQLGTPLEEALDQTIAQTKSDSFRRIMLQASVSIKAGADVVTALQSVIDQLSQERIIELRRYGQKLNAIAMFYMLFGVILPSMGIAVLTILTTFIAIFQVNATVLEFAAVGIVFLQIMFLVLIQNSRPSYSM